MFCLLLVKGTHQASQDSPKRPRDVSNQNKNLSLKGTPTDRVAKSATRTVQALISQKSNESLTSDTGEAPPAPCKHPCKDKSTCGHPCCKRGVTRPHILVTPHTNELPPHPVPPTTQQTVPECKHRCKDKAHCEHPCCKRHLVRVAKPDTYNNKRSDAPVDAREDVKVITAVSVMPVQRSTPCKHVCKNKQTCGHPCCKRNLTPTTYELTSTTASGQESGPKEAPSTRQRDETSPPCTRDHVTQDVKVPKSSNLLGMAARAATRYLFSSRTQPYANGTPSTPAVTVRPHSSTGQERLSYTIAPCPKDEHDLHVPPPKEVTPHQKSPTVTVGRAVASTACSLAKFLLFNGVPCQTPDSQSLPKPKSPTQLQVHALTRVCKHICKSKDQCKHVCCKQGLGPASEQADRVEPCKHKCKNKAGCGHPCCKRTGTPLTSLDTPISKLDGQDTLPTGPCTLPKNLVTPSLNTTTTTADRAIAREPAIRTPKNKARESIILLDSSSPAHQHSPRNENGDDEVPSWVFQQAHSVGRIQSPPLEQGSLLPPSQLDTHLHSDESEGPQIPTQTPDSPSQYLPPPQDPTHPVTHNRHKQRFHFIQSRSKPVKLRLVNDNKWRYFPDVHAACVSQLVRSRIPSPQGAEAALSKALNGKSAAHDIVVETCTVDELMEKRACDFFRS